jgi:hypothetical protein
MTRYFNPEGEPEDVIEDPKNADQFSMFEDGYTSEWKGMPEFKHDFEEAYFEVMVRVNSQEHYEKLKVLLDQSMTMKTKSVWYPKREINPRMTERFVDDEH